MRCISTSSETVSSNGWPSSSFVCTAGSSAFWKSAHSSVTVTPAAFFFPAFCCDVASSAFACLFSGSNAKTSFDESSAFVYCCCWSCRTVCWSKHLERSATAPPSTSHSLRAQLFQAALSSVCESGVPSLCESPRITASSSPEIICILSEPGDCFSSSSRHSACEKPTTITLRSFMRTNFSPGLMLSSPPSEASISFNVPCSLSNSSRR